MDRYKKNKSYLFFLLLALNAVTSVFAAHGMQSPVKLIVQATVMQDAPKQVVKKKQLSYKERAKRVFSRAKNAICTVNKIAAGVVTVAVGAGIAYALSKKKLEMKLEAIRELEDLVPFVTPVKGESSQDCIQRELSEQDLNPYDVEWLTYRSTRKGFDKWRFNMRVAYEEPQTTADRAYKALVKNYQEQASGGHVSKLAVPMSKRLFDEWPSLCQKMGSCGTKSEFLDNFKGLDKSEKAKIIEIQKRWHADYDQLLSQARQEPNDVRASLFSFYLDLVDDLEKDYRAGVVDDLLAGK